MNKKRDKKRFKVCLIGAPQTGKTTFLTRHLTGEFLTDYWPTFAYNTEPLNFMTTDGEYQIVIWDLSGQDKYLKPFHFLEASAALIFYTSETVDETNRLVEAFKKNCPNVPIINLWNQCDLPLEANFFDKFHKENNRDCPTYQISSLTGHNIEKLWIELLQLVTQNPQIDFITD